MSRLLGDASIPKRATIHIDFDAPQNPSTAKREREGPIAKRWAGEGSRGHTGAFQGHLSAYTMVAFAYTNAYHTY
jgi:hypothetical protein